MSSWMLFSLLVTTFSASSTIYFASWSFVIRSFCDSRMFALSKQAFINLFFTDVNFAFDMSSRFSDTTEKPFRASFSASAVALYFSLQKQPYWYRDYSASEYTTLHPTPWWTLTQLKDSSHPCKGSHISSTAQPSLWRDLHCLSSPCFWLLAHHPALPHASRYTVSYKANSPPSLSDRLWNFFISLRCRLASSFSLPQHATLTEAQNTESYDISLQYFPVSFLR